jgi:GNAT superfamily N-acetyltransferase
LDHPASPAGDLTIERVQPETADIAFELMREFADSLNEGSRFNTTLERFSDALFQEPPLIEAIIARYKGELAGYSIFYRVYATWSGLESMHVSGIYVRDAYRTKYVAFGMYLYLLVLAKKRGYGRIDGLVDTWNKPMLDFYARAGAHSSNYIHYELMLDQVKDEDLTKYLPL